MSITNYMLKDSCGTGIGKTRQTQGCLVKVLAQSSDASSTCVGTFHPLLHPAKATDLLFKLLSFGEQFIHAFHLSKSN